MGKSAHEPNGCLITFKPKSRKIYTQNVNGCLPQAFADKAHRVR